MSPLVPAPPPAARGAAGAPPPSGAGALGMDVTRGTTAAAGVGDRGPPEEEEVAGGVAPAAPPPRLCNDGVAVPPRLLPLALSTCTSTRCVLLRMSWSAASGTVVSPLHQGIDCRDGSCITAYGSAYTSVIFKTTTVFRARRAYASSFFVSMVSLPSAPATRTYGIWQHQERGADGAHQHREKQQRSKWNDRVVGWGRQAGR